MFSALADFIADEIIAEYEEELGGPLRLERKSEIRKIIMDWAVDLDVEAIAKQKKLAALDQLTALSEELGMTEATISDFEAMQGKENEKKV